MWNKLFTKCWDTYGETFYQFKRINIYPDAMRRNKYFKIENTFNHEILHAVIFEIMEEDDLWCDKEYDMHWPFDAFGY